jgi:LPXTG-site transpeptidase (sortase) family protein
MENEMYGLYGQKKIVIRQDQMGKASSDQNPKGFWRKIRISKKAYTIFSIVTAVIGIGLIAYPFIPALITRVNPPDEDQVAYHVEEPELLGVNEYDNPEAMPEENRLVIPKIGVDAEILEGNTIKVLNNAEGVWHEPGTGDPLAGGNMVISGHRYQYTPPNMTTFYNLDKVAEGDIMIVYWNQQEYDYKITKIEVVEPTQVEIRNSTPGKNELTVYTCTPLWSNTHRLVVVGELLPTPTQSD